jgi:hypothetical protein
MAPVVPITPTPFASAGFCSVSFGSISPSHASIVAEPAPPAEVPTLLAPGMALLASLLGVLSFAAARRRRATQRAHLAWALLGTPGWLTSRTTSRSNS